MLKVQICHKDDDFDRILSGRHLTRVTVERWPGRRHKELHKLNLSRKYTCDLDDVFPGEPFPPHVMMIVARLQPQSTFHASCLQLLLLPGDQPNHSEI